MDYWHFDNSIKHFFYFNSSLNRFLDYSLDDLDFFPEERHFFDDLDCLQDLYGLFDDNYFFYYLWNFHYPFDYSLNGYNFLYNNFDRVGSVYNIRAGDIIVDELLHIDYLLDYFLDDSDLWDFSYDFDWFLYYSFNFSNDFFCSYYLDYLLYN